MSLDLLSQSLSIRLCFLPRFFILEMGLVLCLRLSLSVLAYLEGCRDESCSLFQTLSHCLCQPASLPVCLSLSVSSDESWPLSETLCLCLSVPACLGGL